MGCFRGDHPTAASFTVLRKLLAEVDVSLRAGPATEQKLRELRRMYEPYVQALGEYLLISMSPWLQVNVIPDNWQLSDLQTPILSIATENSAIQETNGKRFAEEWQ